MALALYMDHHVPRAIVTALRVRGVDGLTAYEHDASALDDARLLDRASALGRVLFTQDDDLLAEAALRQRTGIPFGGVIYAHQLRLSIGGCVEQLAIIAQLGKDDELANQVLFLPL